MKNGDSSVLDWTVIGAGPAGIAAIGKLIDQRIPAHKIGWIDSHFLVGDLGRKWSNVPSNTSVELFFRFLNNCEAFNFKNHSSKFHLESLDPKETCALKYIVEPLQWITDHLRKRVHSIQTISMALSLSQGLWEIKHKTGSLYTKNVILAVGSECKNLSFAGPELINLEVALDPEKLRIAIDPKDTIAVFGSSHSAVLVLANLIELNAKKVINFYRSPHKYAVFLDDWILYDDTGLKGFAAKWAKAHLDGILPRNLERVLISDHTFAESLALCNKAVYAVGFERRRLPVLEQYEHLNYDDRTGIIAPGLFGFGLAFPQAKFNPLGQLDYRVGLWKFMDYLNSILPIWIKYAQ
jgi:cation diffusion facilitator CzcD-associated flavoprotein CzcO